jgi:hypothetical protein
MLMVNFFGNLDFAVYKINFWIYRQEFFMLYFLIMIFLVLFFKKETKQKEVV